MDKQSFLLAILLVINSLHLSSQPLSGYNVKENYKDLFHKGQPGFQALSGQNTYTGFGGVKIYAVVVGVSQYTSMPRLKYTDDDARLFYDHLKSTEGGALPNSQIRLLLEGNATRQNIMLALKQMLQRADGNDVFIFYFSGHGLNGAFLPYDYDGYNNQLYHNEILQLLGESRAKHKLCIADACHSGALDFDENWVAKGDASAPLYQFYDEYNMATNGTALLMSSSAGEASLEDKRLRHGVFTYFLLQGMSGEADFNNDRLIDIRELFHYTYHKVKEHTRGLQSPVLTGDYDDDMPVSVGH